jgi:exopolysaccharide production protein ExoZ
LSSEAPAGGPRFQAIDALRGLAALSVLCFHLSRISPQTAVLAHMLPGDAVVALDYSRTGVNVFFVISGFVIAYSTKSIRWSGRSAGRFIVRRQVRLDPPYYAVIFIAVIWATAKRFVPTLVQQHFTVGDVAINMVYLQGILGRPVVLLVSWTLCLEVQFYLYLVLIGLGTALVFRRHPYRAGQWLAIVTGLVSLALYSQGNGGTIWFISLWWLFCTGMVLCWYSIGRAPRWAVLAWLAIVLAMCVGCSTGFLRYADPWAGQWIGLATAVLIFGLIELRLTAWRPPRVLLFLGAISYSLYLVHVPVIEVVMGGGYKVFGTSRAGAALCWVLAFVVSILAAMVLQRYVEAPAMRWSARLKRPNDDAPTLASTP